MEDAMNQIERYLDNNLDDSIVCLQCKKLGRCKKLYPNDLLQKVRKQ